MIQVARDNEIAEQIALHVVQRESARVEKWCCRISDFRRYISQIQIAMEAVDPSSTHGRLLLLRLLRSKYLRHM